MVNPVLFADGEWVKVLAPVLFFVIWALQQVAAGRQKAAAKAPRAPKAQKPRQDAAEALRRQIETYLAETENQSERQPDAAAASDRAPARRRVRRSPTADPTRAERPAAAAAGRRTKRKKPQAAPQTEAPAPDIADTEVSDVVASSLASHVEDVFTHEVGRLRGSTLGESTPAEEPKQPTAAELAHPDRIVDVVRDPRQLRNAIILSTILETSSLLTHGASCKATPARRVLPDFRRLVIGLPSARTSRAPSRRSDG